MSRTQYYQITLEELIVQYKKGFLNTTGLLFNYIKIKFAPGWKILLDPKKVIAELGISIHQFYRAIAKIKKDLPIRFVTTTRVVGEMPEVATEDKSTTTDTKSTAPNTKPTAEDAKGFANSAKDVAPFAKPVTRDAKTEAETTSKINSSSDSLLLSSNSYSKFISNLSDSEREKFLDFCKKRTDSFEIPLKCGLNTFLAAKNKETLIPYFEEFWELYKKEGGVVRNHISGNNTTGMKPDFPKWYYWMKEIGIMVRKYDWRGEVGAIDNCGKSQSFEEWLKVYSMEEAKQRFEAASRWGR